MVERTRILDLVYGSDSVSFRLPRNGLAVSVGIVEQRGRGLNIELDRVELRSRGRQLLRNPGLRAAICTPDSWQANEASSGESLQEACLRRRPASTDPRLVRVIVPAWRDRYARMNVVVPRHATSSAPLRLTSADGLSGIEQTAQLPSRLASVRVQGRVLSGAAHLVVSWRTGSHLRLVESALRIKNGVGTNRVALPQGKSSLAIKVAIVELLRGGVLELNRVELESGGRQYLRNSTLSFRACPPLANRPSAAFAMPGWLRWPTTFLFLALIGFAVRRAGPARERVESVHELDGFGPEPTGARPSQSARLRFSWLTSVAGDERLLTTLVVSVFLTPLVSVGTIKLRMRLVPADWLLFALGLIVLARPSLFIRAFRDRARRMVAVLGLAFGLVAATSLLLGVLLYSDANLAKLPTGHALVSDIGHPVERGLVDQLRLVQGLLALLAILALVRTKAAWWRVGQAVVAAGTLVSLYGGYQVFSQAAFNTVHQPPGAFPYPELLRASGTFPEPIAYAGFLLFAVAVAVVLLQLRPTRWLYAALVVMVVGVSLSRSTLAVVGLLVLVPGLVYVRDRRSLGLVVSAVAGAVLLVAAAGGSDRVIEAVRKPFTEQNSVQDRKASWEAAAGMGATYSPLGVGRGQYAYNVAPFVDPADADRAGRAESAVLETWAETGAVGLALLTTLFMVGPAFLVRRRLMRTARALILLAALLGVVLLVYYTSTYVWLWVAVGLLVTGSVVFAGPESTESRVPLHAGESTLRHVRQSPRGEFVDRESS